ncbi:hypothetical protein [uncultured Dubosiella sp.]|uniref:hypothetical protein n=1 Tax=uncultured Dubosiella sp. TaxID=1937011 RepID=UPI00262995EC|nr:hypothetical protein [uncultured Dubosiella sp.]
MSKEKSACLKRIVLVIGGYILVCTAVFLFRFHHGWIWILMSGIASLGMVAFLFIHCEKRENLRIRQAESAIKNTMFEKKYTLIECDEEGDLTSLFQKMNTLIVCLDARYDYEKQEKKFLKDLIRDISHQLKTPLATLSIHQLYSVSRLEPPMKKSSSSFAAAAIRIFCATGSGSWKLYPI